MLLLATSSRPQPRAIDAVIDRAVSAHDADPQSQKGRALDTFALRFGGAAPEVPARPAPGGDWTLAETIAEIERRGAKLILTSRGLRLRHAHRLPDVARNATRHERALTAWMDLHQRPVPAPFDAAEWDPGVRLYAAWFALRFEAPPTPFVLRPGETCVDASLLRAGIAGRLAAGPLAPSASRLRSELSALFDAYGPHVQTSPVEVPRRRAA